MKKNNPIKLERYHLNELPRSWERDIEKTSLKEELRELEKSDSEILSQYPAREMAEVIRTRAGIPRKNRETPFLSKSGNRIRPFLIPAAAMILFGLLLPVILFRNSGKDLQQEITRVKGTGDAELVIYREQDGKSEILTENATAETSDLIQLVYRCTPETYGVIISLDGRGVVTRHLPEREEYAVLLETGGNRFLPYSYELDDAPGFETFYLLTSEKPFPLEPALTVIASAARENRLLLDIPVLLQENGLGTEITGRIRQYAIPIRKKD